MPIPPLTTSAALMALANNAFEIIDELGWAWLDPPEPEDDEDGVLASLDAAEAALAFCVRAAVPLADPELVPIVIDCLQTLHQKEELWPRELQESAAAFLSKVGRATYEVRELAASSDPHDRFVVATGLRPVGEPEIALLSDLASDAMPWVRDAARKALAPVGGVPWWRAWFSVDPKTHAAARRSRAVRAAIARVERIDSHEENSPARWTELTRAVRALPEPLALDLAAHVLRAPPTSFTRGAAAPFGAALLERPGGVDALVAIAAGWKDDIEARFPRATEAMMAALGARRRRDVCAALARAALSAAKPGAQYAPEAARFAAEVAANAWPPGADPSPVLDAILASGASVEGSTLDAVCSKLGDVFDETRAVEGALLTRVIGLRLLDYPRGTSSLSYPLDNLILRAPRPIARDVAERAVRTSYPSTIRFGLRHLYGKGYDPRRDPPKEALVRTWLASPQLRSAAVDTDPVSHHAAGLLRDDLARGALTFAEATQVMWSLAWQGGGSATLDRSLNAKRSGQRDADGRPWKPTDEEWRAYRELRSRLGAGESFDRPAAAALVPHGPWDPSDRAFIERMIDEAASHHDSIRMLASTLVAKATPPDRELFARLESVTEDEDCNVDIRELARKFEAKLRKSRRAGVEATRAKLSVVRGGLR